MFGTNILDIAIGMIFVYLLLSLICSAANEIIEGWLKNRATDLERGIRELLDPNGNVSADNIVAKLYNHPLINGLYKGFYEEFVAYHNGSSAPGGLDGSLQSPLTHHNGSSSKLPDWLNTIWRWLKRVFTGQPKLPSYIPARSFALALMDTVLPANEPAPASPPTSPPTFQLSGAAGATQPAGQLASPPLPNPLEPLRDAISTLPDTQTRKALLALVDAAGDDVNKARENIETWFNSSMDRVSGWYKKRSQLIIFLLGFGVAVALNADSVTLVKRLSTDKTLRDSLVVAAEAYAKATPTPTTEATPTGTPVTDTQTTGKPAATPTPLPECVKDANSADCKLAKNRQEIERLNLPLGWADLNNADDLKSQEKLKLRWPGLYARCFTEDGKWERPKIKNSKCKPNDALYGGLTGAGGWWDQLFWHILGWLITALAVSLGAPFWFDLLNKFIVVRSTVKPHEKSPEEPSKA
jgi:hypothetical protein